MELIKRKILIETGISRKSDTSYGLMTASTFNFNILLTQNIDDMGLYIDLPTYNQIPEYTILVDKLNNNGFSYPFMGGVTPPSVIFNEYNKFYRGDNSDVGDWFVGGGQISGWTDSKLNDLKSYNVNSRFIPNFDIDSGVYSNYLGETINGVSRVTNRESDINGKTEYVFDAENDVNIGTMNQTTGIRYVDNSGITPPVTTTEGEITDKPSIVSVSNTSMYYIGEGWNETNTSLSSLSKHT